MRPTNSVKILSDGCQTGIVFKVMSDENWMMKIKWWKKTNQTRP